MGYRKLAKLSVNLLLLSYIRNFLVVAIADERLLRDGAGYPTSQGENLSSGVLELENSTQSDGRLHPSVLSSRPVVFEPLSLDFGSQHVGMPTMHTVKIGNPNRVQTLQLTSISSDSSDLHTSFFRSKIVKGGEWTSFNVVFLARTVGQVKSRLYISTSLGTFDYKVEGIGEPNPFRLRSLLGARIPVNATYSPLISMYNPFSTSLQVTEMYSSGGDLHLELLSGQPQGSKNLWEIKPFETKAIARANFYGRATSNHTSYIRIRTDAMEGGVSLVLPVEVEVSDPSGLFLSRELLDFGILKSGETKTLPLYVLNSGPQQVYVKQVTVEPPSSALTIDYSTTLLKPGSKYTKVAMITFDTKLINASALVSGRIVVSTEDKDKRSFQLDIPYEANVLYGSLSYNRNQTLFRLGRSPFEPITREISLSNQFDVPLVLYDIRIPTKAQDFFSVIHFNSPYIIPPSSQWHKPFAIQFLPTLPECMFNTTLRLSTNASYFNIPLYCYDGRVTYSLEDPEKDVLDFGTLMEKAVMSMMFSVHNVNPIRISILSYEVSHNLPLATLEVISIQSSRKIPSKPPFHLEPGSEATFRLNISYPNKLGSYLGEVKVHTSFDRQLHIPVQYKTAMGTLHLIPDKITFEPTFPYGSSSVTLLAKSIAALPVEVASVTTVPEDSRIYVKNSWGKLPRLKPNTLNEVGNLIFDPLLGEEESIYLGVRGEAWLDTPLPNSSGELRDLSNDTQWFSDLWGIWSSLLDQGLTTLTLGLKLTTDVATEHTVPAHATLHWPKLVSTNMLKFPVTLVGNSSTEVVEVRNPSLVTLTIEPLLVEQCSHPQTIVDILADSFDPNLHSLDFPKPLSSPFTITLQSSRGNYQAIQPNAEPLQIAVAFTPKVGQPSSGLLLIRNNLTVLDYVVLYGQSNHRVLTLEGVAPGTDTIVFEFTSQHLERCQGVHTLAESVQLTRTLKLHNSGTNPITITAITVGMSGCTEHGFSVTRCNKEITLQPDKWKKIDVSFTPDFTLSRVTNTLRIHTSLGSELLFPLVATLPHHLLSTCYTSRPRADWEKTLSQIALPFWVLFLIVLVVVAILQSNISTQGYRADAPLQPTGGRVFDLTDITRSVHAVLNEKLRTSTHPDVPASSSGAASVEQAYDYKQQHRQEGRTPALQAGSSTQQHVPPQQSELRSRPVHTRTISSRSYSVVAPLKMAPPDPATFQSTIAPVNTTTTKTMATTKDVPPPEKSPVAPNVVDKALRPMQSTGEAAAVSQPGSPSSASHASSSSEAPKPKVGVVPLFPSRKVKGVRKVASRKTGAQVPQYVTPSELSPSSVETKSDQLYRKESEMSIRSSDSDTSSGDKQEEREDVTATRDGRGLDTVAEVEGAAKTFVPLTKEPGTGQTVPMVIPEDQHSATTSESQLKQEREREVPVQKLRGRKLRQYQKKEEKLRRRESERSKANLVTAYPPGAQKQPGDNVIASTGAAQGNRVTKAMDKVTGGGGHTGSESSPSPLPQGQSGSKDLSEEPESTLAQSMESVQYQKEKQQHELESSQESHPSTSSPEDRTGEEIVPEVTKVSSLLLDFAVPSSAVRTRTKVSRHTDGSTALTDEEVQKQQPSDDKIKDGTLNESNGCVAKREEEDYDQSGGGNVHDDRGQEGEGSHGEMKADLSDEEDDAKESAERVQGAERPQTLQVNAAESSEGATGGREPATVQEGSDLSPRVGRIGPTSPHELAVSLLSTNQALVRRTKHRDESGEEVEEVKRASSGKQVSKPSVQSGSSTEAPHPLPPVQRHRSTPSMDRSPQKCITVRPSFSPDAPPFVPMEFPPQPMRPRYMGPPPPAPQEVCQGYGGFPGYEDPVVHHRLQPSHPMQQYKQRKLHPQVPMGARGGFPHMEQQLYDDLEGVSADPYGGYEPPDDQPSHMGGRIVVPRGTHDVFDVRSRARVPAQGFPRLDYQQQQEATRMFAAQQHHHHAPQPRMVPPGFQNSAVLSWDDTPIVRQQPPYALQQQDDDGRRLQMGMFRPHGRRSVDSVTMSSHNLPIRASSAHYSHEQGPVSQGGNLWENQQRVSMERSMDMGAILSEHHQHHHHPAHAAPHFQRPTQRAAVMQRTYSEGSDLGGEMLPDLNSSINTPLSSRAPGSLLSSNVSSSQGGGMAGREEPAEERLQWSTGESSSSSAWPSTIWSTSSTVSQDSAPAASLGGVTCNTIGGRTYGLFESSAIWGNNSFSWVQPKSSQEQKY